MRRTNLRKAIKEEVGRGTIFYANVCRVYNCLINVGYTKHPRANQTEFRFNHLRDNLYFLILELLRVQPT